MCLMSKNQCLRIFFLLGLTLIACTEEGEDEEETAASPATSRPQITIPSGQTIANPFTFTCPTHVPHSENTPLLSPPVDIEYFDNTGTNVGDANCDVKTDETCIPGGSIGEVGGAGMGLENAGHVRPTPHNPNKIVTDVAVPIKTMASAYLVGATRYIYNEYSLVFVSTCKLVYNFNHVTYITHPDIVALLDSINPNWRATDSSWTYDFASSYAGERDNAFADEIFIEKGIAFAEKNSEVLNTALDVAVINANITPRPRWSPTCCDHPAPKAQIQFPAPPWRSYGSETESSAFSRLSPNRRVIYRAF